MMNPAFTNTATASTNFDKTSAAYYFDETLRAVLYGVPAFFTTQYIVEGFQVTEHTAEFSSSLVGGVVTGASLLVSIGIYYSHNKLLKAGQEIWLTTWSNFTFLLWAENYVLGQVLKWSNTNNAIPGLAGDTVFISLFLVGMLFSINNDAIKKVISEFFPRRIESNASKPRRVAQKIYNTAAKFFEGIGFGNAIIDPFSKLLGRAFDGINWTAMLAYGLFKSVKEVAPNVASYPAQLWHKFRHGGYHEIPAPPEIEVDRTSAQPGFTFLGWEDRFASLLYIPAIVKRLTEFKNPNNALPIILALISKALLTPLMENRSTYAALHRPLEINPRENISSTNSAITNETKVENRAVMPLPEEPAKDSIPGETIKELNAFTT